MEFLWRPRNGVLWESGRRGSWGPGRVRNGVLEDSEGWDYWGEPGTWFLERARDGVLGEREG